MRTACRISRALLPAVFVFTGGQADGQTFTGIGNFPGQIISQAYALSADGSTVGGYAWNPTPHAMRWTRAGGLQDMGVLPAMSAARVTAFSANGTAAAGYCTVGSNSSGPYRAFYWDGGELIDLGASPVGPDCLAYAMSPDGGTIVGTCGYLHDGPAAAWRAYAWTSRGGYSLLPTSPSGGQTRGLSISPDNSTIGGNFASGLCFYGFRYRQSSGYERLLAAGSSGSLAVEYSALWSLSQDGSIGVGESSQLGRSTVATLWDSGGTAYSMGYLPGGAASGFNAVSADGAVAVGWSQTSSWKHGCIWTQATGLLDVNTYLSSLGIDLTGWVLQTVTGISADGRTISGLGMRVNPTGYPLAGEGWIATLDIPAPAGAWLVPLGAALLARRRRPE